MSKRILTLVLALCMLFSMASVAFAENEIEVNGTPSVSFDGTNPAGTQSVDITAVVQNGTSSQRKDVYSVEVAWGDMKFAWGKPYSSGEIWDPEQHLWVEDASFTQGSVQDEWFMVTTDLQTGDWDAKFTDCATQDGVMIFNHSSLPVDAAIAFTHYADDSVSIANTTITASFTPKSTTVGTYQHDYNTKKYSAYQLTAATPSVPETDDQGDIVKDASGVIQLKEDNRYLDNGSHVRGLVTLSNPDDTDLTTLTTTPTVVAKMTVYIFKGTYGTN